jgi:mannan endo-1,4-beta-mannosidase
MTLPPPEPSEPWPPQPSEPWPPRPAQPGRRSSGGIRAVVIGACVVVVVAAVTVGVTKVAVPSDLAPPPGVSSEPPIGTFSHHPVVITLPAHPASYLGIFAKGVPDSYAPIASVANATGVRPNIALYYSGRYEKFRSIFAVQVKDNGAVPFIQMEPSNINLAAIASGAFDTYLETFATDVANYGARTGQGVIIGFGHEMNGYWYSWAHRHTSPAVFVAAWRHVVNVFRQQGADDVTWLWTVNIIDRPGRIPSPAPWWPGSTYVTWVGIDGYYFKSSWTFASLFGPTIKAVRAMTLDPILIAETGAAPEAGKPAKIADLFTGVRAYGLLGFVWFDANGVRDWRLNSPAAIAAFARGAKTFKKPVS